MSRNYVHHDGRPELTQRDRDILKQMGIHDSREALRKLAIDAELTGREPLRITSTRALQAVIAQTGDTNDGYYSLTQAYILAAHHFHMSTRLLGNAITLGNRYAWSIFPMPALLEAVLSSPKLTPHLFRKELGEFPLRGGHVRITDGVRRQVITHPYANRRLVKKWIRHAEADPKLFTGDFGVILDPDWRWANYVSEEQRSRLLVTVASI